jgi:ATP-dependent helicase/nuclease subunit B
MEQAHRESPLSYTFLGPTGEFVKEFSEWFSRRLHLSILRSNFMVIDQFADELYSQAHPETLYADKHLLRVFIANILGSATQKELGPFYPLKDSLGLVGFVAEAVIEAKDDGEASLMARLANDQARSIVQFALREIEVGYGANLYDTFDAYLKINAEEIRDYISLRFSKSLFLDGFTNLSWAQIIFLSKIIPLFQEAFMTLDPISMDKDSWAKFLELLAAKSVEVLEEELASSAKETLPLQRLLRDQGSPAKLEGDFIRVACLKDPEEELMQVCRDIKWRIVDDDMLPGEIAVVMNNFSERAREFSRKLDEYGVAVKVSGDEPLSSSIAIQLLILPFRAALAGYPSHLLISMLDHGLGLPEAPQFDLDGLEALARGAGLYIGPRRSSLQERRAEWKAKLESHLEAQKKRLEVLSQDDNVYDSDLQAKEAEIRLCQEMLDKSGLLFEALQGIEKFMEEGTYLERFKKELASWMEPLKVRFLDNEYLETEAQALSKFEQLLGKLEVAVNIMGGKSQTLQGLMAVLEILISSEEYRPSSPLANQVEILPLHSARFRHRSMKYVVDFNDGIFPSRRSNPLYSLDGSRESPGYYQIKEREQRSALYSCLCSSSQAVITYLSASREGEQMMPSLWLDNWIFEKTNALERETAPMSSAELMIQFGRGIAQGGEPVLPESTQSLVAPLKLYDDSEFSWRIEDLTVVQSLVGRSLSYTRLSEICKCPFKFFLRRMLRLKEQSNELYELSPIEKGITYHAALKTLYDWKQEENATWDKAIEDGKVKEVVESIMQRFLVANTVRSLPSVRRSMAEDAIGTIQGYLEFERDNAEKACIGEKTLVELPFELRLADMACLASGCGEKYGDIILRGRIDRIDINVALKKKVYDLVLSDYKAGSSGEWDQLKLYTLVLLSLEHKDLPRSPELIRSFFRKVRERKISMNLDAITSQRRMDLSTRPKSSLSFSDVDSELLQTLDRIFEKREFRPGKMIEEKGGDCYFCGLKQNCESILNCRGGMQ